ncbi:hypothetical protein PRIPAC_78251 [Pristionchus pacificus]|uniref:Nuclear receptor n=1 Tax=Pristionchus pacificus TaxID=54126 RepID=A0A2A6CPT8_PRIPA|nr:hypothetical protein PRIPAC_78251 [Pristionchus pacificus]|eukprot:PDM80077.1 nuclear receptor [Pristionchus pacificus]
MECLICSDSIQYVRMGINACRPCAAFYKRAIGQEGALKCNEEENNCWNKNPKTTCRKCRFSRFVEVLELAREPSPTCEDSSDSQPSSFIDHTSFYECEPTGSKTPLLDKIRKGYSLMCVIRLSGEIALKAQNSGGNYLTVNNMTLTPAKYDEILPHTRIAMRAIIEFANLAFDDFRSLEKETKKGIVESSYSLMNILDATYRLYHHFPGDMTMILPGYTTYTRDTDFDLFFANCPVNMDKARLVNEIKKSRDRSSKTVRKYFERSKPNDMEFLALFGLALWSDEVLERNENLLRVANNIRSNIMCELHHHYVSEEIPEYASRLGNVFCLLANCQARKVLENDHVCHIQIQSGRVIEDFQIYRLLNLFGSEFDGYAMPRTDCNTHTSENVCQQ